MAVSQNSYPANNRAYIHTLTVPGTAVRLPVRKGPAGDLLIWAAERWHREVEPLVDGWNWGYAERNIRGSSTTLSNHASGTAIDLNAPRHPLGVAVSKNLSPAQIAKVRRIIADAKGCLVWGGEWSRPDAMHIEVSANEAKCAAVLAQLKTSTPTPPGDDMAAVPQEQWEKVYRQETALFEFATHHGATKDDQLGHTLSIRKELVALRGDVRRLAEAVAALAAKG